MEIKTHSWRRWKTITLLFAWLHTLEFGSNLSRCPYIHMRMWYLLWVDFIIMDYRLCGHNGQHPCPLDVQEDHELPYCEEIVMLINFIYQSIIPWYFCHEQIEKTQPQNKIMMRKLRRRKCHFYLLGHSEFAVWSIFWNYCTKKLCKWFSFKILSDRAKPVCAHDLWKEKVVRGCRQFCQLVVAMKYELNFQPYLAFSFRVHKLDFHKTELAH